MYVVNGKKCSGLSAVASSVGRSLDWVARRIEHVPPVFTTEDIESVVVPGPGGDNRHAQSVTLQMEGKPDVVVGFYEMEAAPERFGLTQKTATGYRFRWHRAGSPKKVTPDFFNCEPRRFQTEYSTTDAKPRGSGPAGARRAYLLDEYPILPIELPKNMTEAEMAPYRSVAAAVLIGAVKDLIPVATRGELSASVRDAARKRQVSEAVRFLTGESSPEDLRLWCSLLDMSPEMVKRAIVKDRVGIARRIGKLTRGAGRGRTRNQRCAL